MNVNKMLSSYAFSLTGVYNVPKVTIPIHEIFYLKYVWVFCWAINLTPIDRSQRLFCSFHNTWWEVKTDKRLDENMRAYYYHYTMVCWAIFFFFLYWRIHQNNWQDPEQRTGIHHWHGCGCIIPLASPMKYKENQ